MPIHGSVPEDKPTHTIISIGWLGDTYCYLDISREEAIKRWCENEGVDELPSHINIDEVTITDQWQSYDGAWLP